MLQARTLKRKIDSRVYEAGRPNYSDFVMERTSQRVTLKEAEPYNSVENPRSAILLSSGNKEEKMKSEQVVESRKETRR